MSLTEKPFLISVPIQENATSIRLVHPIDDLEQRAAHKNCSEAEKKLRCQLASAYRLADFYGWSEGIYNHITCRIPGRKDHFLINPFGLQFHEITASSLIILDADGNTIDEGSTNLGPNPRGFTLHSAVHMARRDVQCVFHTHLPEVIAISCQKDGFKAVCQEGMSLGPVSTLDFSGFNNDSERDRIAAALGNNNALLLRNHGFFACAGSIPETMLKAFCFVYNTRAQLHMSSNQNLVLPTPDAAKRAYDAVKNSLRADEDQNGSAVTNGVGSNHVTWGPGELDWEANMRFLDTLGLKTGHQYKQKVWRNK